MPFGRRLARSSKMQRDGVVEKTKRGKYALPGNRHLVFKQRPRGQGMARSDWRS